MNERMKTHGDFGWCDLITDNTDKARDRHETGWAGCLAKLEVLFAA